MVLLHPALNTKPALCAAVELATGLRADIFNTKSGNYVVGLVSPRNIAIKTVKPTPQRFAFGQDPFGGNAA
jgi:hypothetical protein